MDDWLDRAVKFIDWLALVLDRAADQLGFGAEYLVAVVIVIYLIVDLVRKVPSQRADRDRHEPAVANRQLDALHRRDELASNRAKAESDLAREAAVGDGQASRLVAAGFAFAGLAICAAAGYWMYTALQGAAESRPNAFLFGSLLALIGIALARAGAGGLLRSSASVKRNSGWLNDARWSADGTGPVASERLVSGLIGLTLFAAYLVPFHTLLAPPWTQFGFWLMLALLDLLLMVALVFYLRSLRAWMLGGRARLIWSNAPFRTGQAMRVRFETSKALAAEATVVLFCLRGSSGGQLLDEEPPPDAKEVYTDQCRFHLQRSVSGGCYADIHFQIPQEQPGSLRSGGRFVCWRLAVRAAVNGPDYEVSFALPLYSTEA